MSRSNRVWMMAAVLAAVAGIALALLHKPHGAEMPAPPPGAAAPSSHASAPTPARFPSPAVLAERPVPPGVSAEQWAALEAELAGQPRELERLAAHYAFADLVRRYRATPAGDARRALAQQIDAGLDARLEAGELSAGEARLIKLAMLRELQPDEATRRIALSQWETALAARPDGAAAQQLRAQDEDFQRRQQQLVAAWRARPPAARDPKELERELEALRRAVYRTNSYDTPR